MRQWLAFSGMYSPVSLRSLVPGVEIIPDREKSIVKTDFAPTRIRGVALDMDGLMFDTEPLYHRAADTLLARHGHRYEDAVRRQMMGQPGPKAIQIMVDYYGLTDSWEQVLAESDAIFATYLATDLRPLPGLYELLQLFDSLGLPYGVATSSRRSFAEEILGRGNVRQRMQFVLTGDDVRHGKPDPEIYLLAAKQLQIAPEEMLVLEDSENGCLAAVTAGANVVAVPGEHSADHNFAGTCGVIASLLDESLRSWIALSTGH
jgi:HAD superfamily hydrolase (TIGR01509 family)